MHSRFFIFSIVVNLSLCASAFAQPAFTEVSRQAGIKHQFEVFGGAFGGGACVFDFNNDGWEDLYITGGLADDQLLLNKKDGTFENVFDRSGLKTTIKYITQGVTSADVNRDGWRDLFITTITSRDNHTDIPRAMNLLFLNNGNGTFRDVTKEFGLDTILTFSTGAMFGDVNLDGYPDLYVGNYFHRYEGKLDLMNDAMIVASKQMANDLLLINRNGKKFVDESESYGLSYDGYGFGGTFTDFDKDGDLDIMANRDFGYKAPPNRFFENEYPRERFNEISDTINMQLQVNAMGVAVGDFNNDGWFDYYVTNIRANPFMVNRGPGQPFENRNAELGTRLNMIRSKQDGGLLPVSWGANFADFDNDGDLDLYVANGCLNPSIMPNPDFYFENKDGRFIEMADSMGLADRGISRGSIVFDYDKDGDLDILVVNQKPAGSGFEDASPTLLFRNDMPRNGNWTEIKLTGIEADRTGIGSRVEVVAGTFRMIREIDGGSSHLSQNAAIAHFGIGAAKKIDTINVYWLGGDKQTFVDQEINQLIVLKEVPVRRWYRGYGIWVVLAGLLIAGVLVFLFFKNRK